MPVEVIWIGAVLLVGFGTLIFALAAPTQATTESAEATPVRPSEIRR